MKFLFCSVLFFSASSWAYHSDVYDYDQIAAECKANTLKKAVGITLSEALDIHNECIQERLPTIEQIRDWDEKDQLCRSAPDGCYP